MALDFFGTIPSMMYRKKPFFKRPFGRMLLILAGLAVVGLLLYQVPYFHDRLSWRLEYAGVYARSIIDPAGNLPTPKPSPEATAAAVSTAAPTAVAEVQPTAAPTVQPTTAPTAAPTNPPPPLPEQVILPAPKHEKEDLNACGPATLAMALRFWGWEGDQFTISKEIKQIRADRNVNVEELKYYVDNFVPGMSAEFRVGGDLELLRRFLADGMPVMIEESFMLDKNFRVGDDRWAGHYLLITGYDDSAQQFIAQDSERGPNRFIAYDTLEKDWQSFNHVYILIYPPDKQNNVLNLLGAQFDYNTNRQYALDQAKAVTVSDPTNAYAWFNLGTNLMYFGRYEESAAAYDQARDLGLPQRMLRYQFGPFITYFNLGRIDDLSALADYALEITPNSEEALLWKGWALFRQAKRDEALASFQAALDAHPNYGDALYAINYVYNN